MDITKRDALLHSIKYTDGNECFPAAVTLEEFFDGNDDLSSFWCNLESQPQSMETIRAFLQNIRARSDVADLKILVTQFDDGPDEWPFSDTVLIDTDVDPEEVAGWFGEYAPDEVDFADREARKLSGFANCIFAWWD